MVINHLSVSVVRRVLMAIIVMNTLADCAHLVCGLFRTRAAAQGLVRRPSNIRGRPAARAARPPSRQTAAERPPPLPGPGTAVLDSQAPCAPMQKCRRKSRYCGKREGRLTALGGPGPAEPGFHVFQQLWLIVPDAAAFVGRRVRRASCQPRVRLGYIGSVFGVVGWKKANVFREKCCGKFRTHRRP